VTGILRRPCLAGSRVERASETLVVIRVTGKRHRQPHARDARGLQDLDTSGDLEHTPTVGRGGLREGCGDCGGKRESGGSNAGETKEIATAHVGFLSWLLVDETLAAVVPVGDTRGNGH